MNTEIKFEDSTPKDWDKIYKEMQLNFAKQEIRDYKEFIKTLDNKQYFLKKIIFEKDFVGFIAMWEFEGFTFFEHFVIFEKFRNKGIGTKVLNLMKNNFKNIVFETELPDTQISKRRLDLYLRNGFVLNNFNYSQPAYRIGDEPFRMHIMSYPKRIKKTGTEIKTIYKQVYKV